MRALRKRLLPVCAALIAGCAAPVPFPFPDAEEPEISAAIDRQALPEAIVVCHGYGCGVAHRITLQPGEWSEIRSLFASSAASADGERRAISQAIGLFEQAAGRLIGTWRDAPRSPFVFNDPAQLDCVDESINTSSFLHLLARQGLMRWHTVGEPARRYALLIFGVHYTAVVAEKQTGVRYAVDSWFHANGAPAEVVELERWRGGWEPDPRRSPLEARAAP